MQLEHPEVLAICMFFVLSLILGTCYYVLNYLGKDELKDNKKKS